MKNKHHGNCPLCGRPYTKSNPHTMHHIYYPKRWFQHPLKVDVCHICHQVEFHNWFPVTKYWDKRKCLLNWYIFCARKGKNANEVYPEIL